MILLKTRGGARYGFHPAEVEKGWKIEGWGSENEDFRGGKQVSTYFSCGM